MKKVFELLMVFVLLSASSIMAMKTAEASELNFSVVTELPENQLDSKKTYFDLLMTSDQTQTVHIHLANETDKEVIVEPVIHSATTNSSGVVEYGESVSEKDQSLVHDMTELIDVVSNIKIPAKGHVKLPVTIRMPKEKVTGKIVGGITLKEQATAEKKEPSAELAIENLYSYVVAIVLQDNQTKIEPELQLNQVVATQKNYRNVIEATVQNSTPTFINKLAIETSITKKGEKELLYQENKNEMQVAPNTNFNYPISLKGEKMAAGDYTLRMTATSKDHRWEWSKDFTIKPEVARELNQQDVSIPTDNNWLLYLVVGLLLTLVIILLGLLRKKQAQPEK